MTILHTELTTVSTNGPLEVRGDDFDTALFVDGQPLAYFWSDFAGSVGQNLVRAISPNPNEAIQRFRGSVARYTAVDKSIDDSFPEFLSILATGEYRLEIEEMPSDSYVVEGGMDGISNFYPGFGALVATQPRASLNEEIVRDYDRCIADGVRPVVVTLTGARWNSDPPAGCHQIEPPAGETVGCSWPHPRWRRRES